MKKIAIVEDSLEYANILKSFLELFFGEHDLPFLVTHFSDALDFFSNYKSGFDIVLMDIKLPYMDGIEAAKKLYETDRHAVLIFVTNLAQYAVKGYEVNAFDFIVKPISYYDFSMKMNRVLQYQKNRRDGEIWLQSKKEKIRCFISSLKYVEVVNHKIIYHLENRKFVSSGSLRKVQEQLKEWECQFALCNQCYLVNLAYVSGVDEDDVTIEDEKLRISRPKRKDFLKAITAYINGRG